MKEQFYPELIRRLPEADLPWSGLRAWVLGSELGQVAFFECDEAVEVGEHTHGSQLIVVLDGELRLTIEGEERTLRKGDTYCIPSGVRHSAHLSSGFRSIDVFEDPERYNVK